MAKSNGTGKAGKLKKWREGNTKASGRNPKRKS